ncbi:MAG: HAD family hydrolase [Saprospiraceae bacterium]
MKKTKTLFLDRDGVINRRPPGDYVQSWSAFHFLPGVLEAIKQFSLLFDRIIIVTNQQGIGKGMMSTDQLTAIHQQMQQAIASEGGRIDAIYFCPDLSSKVGNCRKPNPAMALQAQQDFPEIDFQQSIMVGDSISDLQFGQSLGMKTVLVQSKADEKTALELAIAEGLQIDLRVDGLPELAEKLKAGWN